MSNGFLSLNLKGLFVECRTYEKNGNQVVLLPTVHIAAPSFYDEIMQTFPADQAVILPEGVTDNQGLLKVKLDYSGVADAVGLSAQPNLTLRRKEPSVRHYDADIADFSKQTVETLNAIAMVIQSATTSGPLTALEALSGFTEPDTEVLIKDILETRNARVVSGVEKELSNFKYIALPWGAAHMPGIERGLLKLDMHKVNQQRFNVFLWDDLNIFKLP
ncbi:MAG: hypothetical protein EBS01_01055 [Verrucomicrobia bacterium]|nr:hypothetical protein [Verrucomicrobiota bacterium]